MDLPILLSSTCTTTWLATVEVQVAEEERVTTNLTLLCVASPLLSSLLSTLHPCTSPHLIIPSTTPTALGTLEALLTTGTTAPLTREESDQVRDLANMLGLPMGGAYLIPLVEEAKRLEEEKEEEKEKEEKEDKEEEEEREKEEDTEQEEDAEQEEEKEEEEKEEEEKEEEEEEEEEKEKINWEE